MKTDRSVEDRLVRSLDAQAGGLDAETLSKLRQVRARAVEQADQPPGSIRFMARPWALLAGGIAALIGLAIALSVLRQDSTPHTELRHLVGAPAFLVEMAEAEVDIELIEEIEFYDWLVVAQTDGESE